MSGIRSFPLRTRPRPGESLYSWLQANARRLDVSVSELYEQMGLQTVRDLRTRLSVLHVSDEDAEILGAATGCSTDAIHAMTLAPYALTTAEIFGAPERLTALARWHRVGGTQFCPHCLADSGGAWKVEWALIWSFACLQHRCLLAAQCPTCGRRPRLRILTRTPAIRPCHCDMLALGARGRPRRRCDADLRRTSVTKLSADHPVLAAQATMNALLATGVATFGVYRRYPRPTVDALADIRILGRNILRAAANEHLDKFVPPDLIGEYAMAVTPDKSAGPRGRSTPRRDWLNRPPVVRATAVTAALRILQSPDLRSAAAPLTALPDDVSRYELLRKAIADKPHSRGTRPASPVLRAIELTAMDTRLSPVDQLHCRLGTPFPQRPLNDSRRRARLRRSTPTFLWSTWALRLCPPSFYQSSVRSVLSAAVLMVSTTLDAEEAAVMLGNAVTASNVNFVLWRLKASPGWDDIRGALICLADHLYDNGAPIDYERRRRLDYTELLPHAAWAALCRRVGRPTPGIRTVRRYLRQHISGVCTGSVGAVPLEGDAAYALAEFPCRLTPELADGLDECAADFLASQGITDEPVSWEPAIELIRTLNVPGQSVDDLDIELVHRLVRTRRSSTRVVARELHTTAHLIRHALMQNPAPASVRPPRQPRIGAQRPGRVYRRAANAIPREQLRELYIDDQQSLASIGVSIGVSNSTVKRLARDYGMPLRKPGGRSRRAIDPAWLYAEYVTKHRSMRELSHELSVSQARLVALAKQHAMPVRTVARHTRSELRANANVPSILVPALAGHGGW